MTRTRAHATRRIAAGTATAFALILATACGGDDSEPTLTGVPDPNITIPATEPTLPPASPIVAGEAMPADRCEANRAAGTITFLTGFNYAAAASMTDVYVAEANGYFDAMCLDVDVVASFSVDNYPLVAANEAQFASAGSFSELLDYSGRNEAEYVALSVEGRTGIDALLVTDESITSVADLAGSTIGVKGKITPSVAALLAQEGLIEGTDYQTVLLDGFDPKAHAVIDGIVGFPGYKSNEPKQLEAAGIPFTLFNPAESDIPGSFGVIYTNKTFATEHPTAVEDFMRATMRGLADAIADPVAAATVAVELINGSGNAMFLSPEGETARWSTEAAIVSDAALSDAPAGVPVVELLQKEVETYAGIGLFDGVVPDITTVLDNTIVAGVYAADGTVIWPAE
jgi:ABC-type nitrate/sulfonate/bicarbonate transport system substrate-binding protein